MTALLLVVVLAMAGYFYWVVATALVRGRTPDFGRHIVRSEEPGRYWTQVILCTWMALGSTIFALFLIGDMTRK